MDFVSPEKEIYRGYIQRRRRLLFACPEHNFLTLSSNDTKLGVHVSITITITLPYVFLGLFPFDTFCLSGA